MNNDTAILISSFDGAQDLWKPLHQSYQKYWPDCPYQIYLATNFIDPSLERFKTVLVGKEESWSDNIFKSLQQIREKYVLLIFDDVFLYKSINTNKLSYFINKAIFENWSYLRLSPRPKYDNQIEENIGQIKKDRLYRTSTAWALFKREVLIDLLDLNESAWDFEIKGSNRSNKYDDFYSIDIEVLPYLNGVVKGKWVNKHYKHLLKDGIDVSDLRIKRMSFKDQIIYQLIVARSYIFEYLVPRNFKQRIRQFFYK